MILAQRVQLNTTAGRGFKGPARRPGLTDLLVSLTQNLSAAHVSRALCEQMGFAVCGLVVGRGKNVIYWVVVGLL